MNQYREGKVKSTPVRGVKEYLKPYAYKQWEGYAESGVRPSTGGTCVEGLTPDSECLTACLLHNEPAS